MKVKKCFKCLQTKPLSDYYVHKQMGDGHLNKCKDCTKADVKNHESILKQNPEYIEKERNRGREKYHRLSYRGKNKQPIEKQRQRLKNSREKFPEKHKAVSRTCKMKRTPDHHLHHWSYNKEHYKDVIELSIKDHNTAHRFMIYDQERMMYRTLSGVLLDTKESHLEYINDKF
jgi:hypothetical protein